MEDESFDVVVCRRRSAAVAPPSDTRNFRRHFSPTPRNARPYGEELARSWLCPVVPRRAPGAVADGTPAGPLAGYPMTDTWTDHVAFDGVLLVGDSAGWSDPVIGQGMAVAFLDVHMVTDVKMSGSDWSSDAFASYSEERRERMRRLRFASADNYLTHGFGPDGAAKRRRLGEMFATNPASNPRVSALRGAWVLPEDTYSDAAWRALG